MQRTVDVAIIGAGTAGINAMTEVRKVTDSYVLINGGLLGTTCARVGCMPSKALIQIADDFHRRGVFETEGIGQAEHIALDVERSLAYMRALRDRFVDGIVAEEIRPLESRFIEGYCEFREPNLLQVEGARIRTRRTIIATGSRPAVLDAWRPFGDRILTTDTIFEQPQLSRDIGVVGLGAVGLELGQALARMEFNVTGFDEMESIGGLHDPEVNRRAIEILRRELPIHLGKKVEIRDEAGRLRVATSEAAALVDKVLLSIGRIPNVDRLRLDRLGLELDQHGLPPFDRETMQVGGLPIFIAGDVDRDRPVLHEAAHEGRVAGYNAVHDPPVAFRRKTPLAIAFTDPNICVVGAAWNRLKEDEQPAVGSAHFTGGREKIMLREEGMMRVYGDRSTGRLLGAEMAAPGGEHLAHQVAWSIQQGLTVFQLLSMPFYHPTIEETLQRALKDLAKDLAKDMDTEDSGRPLLGFEAAELPK